jgi:hypothetical protein
MKQRLILISILLCTFSLFAQDDIPLDTTLNNSSENIVDQTFPAIQIFNHPTTDVLPRGEMKLYLGHRMGEISTGIDGLFGLYSANSRFGVDLGILKNVTIGIGSTSQSKLYDGYAKWLILKQGWKKMPVSIGVFTNATIATGDLGYPSDAKVETWQRLSYTTELMFSRKFCDRFSAQLMASYVHRNMTSTINDKNGVFAAGVAANIKITNVWNLAAEYSYVPKGQVDLEGFRSSQLSVGVQIHTGPRHVFQLFFSNSGGINENTVLTQSTGGKGLKHLRLCFNIPTTFKIF